MQPEQDARAQGDGRQSNRDHGSHDHEHAEVYPAVPGPVPSSDLVKDPVCGMDVDSRTSKYRAEHEGRTYYFCSAGCRARFVAEPTIVNMSLADSLTKGSTVYFPVVQECAKGAVVRWIQIPAAGKSEDDYSNPAPGLKITG